MTDMTTTLAPGSEPIADKVILEFAKNIVALHAGGLDPSDAIGELRQRLCTPTNSAAIEVADRLREAAWRIDSHEVTFDETVVFGSGYNFEGLENGRLEYAGRLGWAVIWPEDWPHNKQWRYYCEPDGVMPTRPLPDKLSAMLAAEDIVEGGSARALPQDTGFAAGVAACVGEINSRIREQKAFRAEKLFQGRGQKAHYATLAILTLEEVLQDLSNLSPQPDKGLREALEFIAESHDAGRHDGLPEPCPAHDADTMWAVAVAALSTQEKQG